MLYYIYKSQIGPIQITIQNKYVTNITIDQSKMRSYEYNQKESINFTKEEKDILNKLVKQLDQYFLGEKIKFDIPLKLDYLPFTKKVYECLLNTEHGKTYTYKEIAKMSGSPRAMRAVGSAMRKNEYAIVIPCHRVINANGKIGKYFGQENLKEKLINLESKKGEE